MPTTSEVSTRLSADNSNYRTVFKQSEDIADKTGKAILKKIDLRAGVGAIAAAIGFNMQAIAEGVARFVTGFSKDEEKRLEELVDKTGKAADEQERQLAKARDRAEKKRMEAGERELAQMKLVSDARQEAIKLAVEEEKKARQSVYDQQVKADEEHMSQVEANLELLTLTAKATQGLTQEEADRLEVLKLIVKQKSIEAEITTLLSLNDRTPEEEARLQVLIRENNVIKDQVANVGKVKDAVAEIAPVIEGNIEKWRNFQKAITATGRGDKELSDRELARKISAIQQDIFQRSLNGGGADIGSNILLEAQRGNLAQTQSEINFRRDVRQRASTLGEDAAFKQFPGLTEQRFREILQGIDTSSTGKLATAIDKLNQRLDAPLLATLKPSPFGP